MVDSRMDERSLHVIRTIGDANGDCTLVSRRAVAGVVRQAHLDVLNYRDGTILSDKNESEFKKVAEL